MNRFTKHTGRVIGLCALALSPAAMGDLWPMWRGPDGTGVAPSGNPPTTWSETKNIKWKIELPDTGDCTPVVWGDRIFIQTSIATREDLDAKVPSKEETGRVILSKRPTVPFRFGVMCLDRNTGETLWETTVLEAVPHEGHHPSGSFSSFSPVTDGQHVWVSFGSRGLHCVDVDGNHKWSADLTEMEVAMGFGEGSSPAVVGDAVIAVCDHLGESKIFAFHKLTGDPLWEKDRDEVGTWSTPMAITANGISQVVTSGANAIRSYDPATGEVLWQCSGLGPDPIPTPVFGNGMVYCMTGFQTNHLLAIALGGTADLTDTDAVKWTLDEHTPYVSSPLLYGNRIYFASGLRAAISAYNAESGEPLYETEKLPGMKQIYASLVGAGGHVYVAGRKGTVVVLKDADVFEVVATNTLDEGFDASPVVIGDELYLRGENHLYCIAAE